MYNFGAKNIACVLLVISLIVYKSYKSSVKYCVCVTCSSYDYYLTVCTGTILALNHAYVLRIISLILTNSMYKCSAYDLLARIMYYYLTVFTIMGIEFHGSVTDYFF